MKQHQIPYKNPNLLVDRIERNFYYVVNPFIKDGMKVINVKQYKIFDIIDGEKDIEQIKALTGFKEEDIVMVCKIFETKNMINFTNIFQKPIWDRNTKTMHFWVHTSNECSLRCSYCYIHTLGQKDFITEETIEIFLDKVLQTVKERELERVSLRLAGGEPLLKFPLWKTHLVDLKHRLHDFHCKLQITFLSNLVYISEEIIKFIKENSFGIGVSLDGIGEFQDKTRHFANGKGSYSLVEQNIKQLSLFQNL